MQRFVVAFIDVIPVGAVISSVLSSVNNISPVTQILCRTVGADVRHTGQRSSQLFTVE